MIVGIGEIPSSILTVIPKNSHFCYLLTNAMLYCKILFKAHGFEVQTEFARFMCKKRELSISQYGISNTVNK